MLKESEGFIYVYKCMSGNNLCKIGVTNNLKRRLMNHKNTPYHGFLPYANFLTGEPIVTGFRVLDMTLSDNLVKEHFHKCQISNLEVYSISYNEAIKELYVLLNKHNQFQELIEDGITDYCFLNDLSSCEDNTDKSSFEAVKGLILVKYDELPSKVLSLLRDAKDFQEHCYSHFKSGNYIYFTDNLVLDLHSSKAKRFDILCKLRDLL